MRNLPISDQVGIRPVDESRLAESQEEAVVSLVAVREGSQPAFEADLGSSDSYLEHWKDHRSPR